MQLAVRGQPLSLDTSAFSKLTKRATDQYLKMVEALVARAAPNATMPGDGPVALKVNETATAEGEQGRTALFYAAEKGHEKMMRALHGAGANVDLADATGETPLMAAARNGHEGAAKLLVGTWGADRMVKNKAGETAEQIATRLGHTKTARVIAAGLQ